MALKLTMSILSGYRSSGTEGGLGGLAGVLILLLILSVIAIIIIIIIIVMGMVIKRYVQQYHYTLLFYCAIGTGGASTSTSMTMIEILRPIF